MLRYSRSKNEHATNVRICSNTAHEAKIGLELCSSWTQHQQLADLWRSLDAFLDEKREGDKLDKSKAQKKTVSNKTCAL